MLSSMDRRESERRNCRGSIRIASLNNDQSQCALITDISEGGLGLRSTMELKTGRYLLIRLETLQPDEPDKLCEVSLRSLEIGEVKWCRTGKDDVDMTFAAGVKFLVLGY